MLVRRVTPVSGSKDNFDCILPKCVGKELQRVFLHGQSLSHKRCAASEPRYAYAMKNEVQ